MIYVAQDQQETEDGDLADIAMSQNRIVLTEDRDFGRIVFRKEKEVPGIVYFRFSTKDRAMQWPKLKALLDAPGDGIYGHFIVIDKERTRIRPLPDA